MSALRSFCCLGTDVQLHLRTAAPADRELLAAGLAQLTAGYASATGESRAMVYELRCGERQLPQLLRDGVEVAQADEPFDLLARFEGDLYPQLARRCAGRWVVHGGAVCDEQGRAVVLVGGSGAGKSTLTLSLCARGARYIADDCVAIAPDGRVEGISRPIGLDAEALEIIGDLPGGFAVQPALVQRPAGSPGDPLMVTISPDRIAAGGRLLAIVALRHAPALEPSWWRLSAGEALTYLWPQSMGGAPEAIELARGIVAAHPGYGLITRTVDAACRSLEALWHDGGR